MLTNEQLDAYRTVILATGSAHQAICEEAQRLAPTTPTSPLDRAEFERLCARGRAFEPFALTLLQQLTNGTPYNPATMMPGEIQAAIADPLAHWP